MTELEQVYNSADRNYRESLRMLGDSILLVQDFVDLYHRLLKTLGDRYDMCAKRTHPSIYAFAGRSTVEESEKAYTLKFQFFQAERDGSEPIRTFFVILNTHILIFNVFREVLADALGDHAGVLELHANSTDAKYMAHAEQWAQRIPALRPSAR